MKQHSLANLSDLIIAGTLCSCLSVLGAGSPTPQPADQFQLGKAHESGSGMNQSYEEAGMWYRKAAESGDVKAMVNLGRMYLLGLGTKQDGKEATHWLKLAASHDDPKARTLLGAALCEGKYLPKDEKAGVAYLKQAVAQGEAHACARLGQFYLFGDAGLPKDPSKAVPLLEKASEGGIAWATGALAKIVRDGSQPELTKGLSETDLLRRGAENGDPWCRLEYAQDLLRTNPTMAYSWFKICCEQSTNATSTTASLRIGELEGNMTAAERVLADENYRKLKQTLAKKERQKP
jgi:TPR repeat protein